MAKGSARGSDNTPSALTHNPFAGLKKQAVPPPSAETPRVVQPRERPVRVHLEAKGRSGKVVTRILGLPAPNAEAIAERLRKALGCRATLEGEDLLLEGSLKERATEWLERAGDLRAIREPEKPKRLEPAEAPREPDLPSSSTGSGTKRSDIQRGEHVAIVLKADQGSGKLTHGVVRDILTSSPTHPRGIKVRLETGEVGRVQVIFGRTPMPGSRGL